MQGHADYTGFACVPLSSLSQVYVGAPRSSASFPKADDEYEIYWNGRKIGIRKLHRRTPIGTPGLALPHSLLSPTSGSLEGVLRSARLGMFL